MMKEDWLEVKLGEVCEYSKGKKPKVVVKKALTNKNKCTLLANETQTCTHFFYLCFQRVHQKRQCKNA